jgi:flagellar hook-associated protein 1 FlgK
MADLLSTGISALRAFQQNLDVTGHNVANVDTPGYSRQRVDMSARVPTASGNGYIGNGVQVDTVRRLYNDFLAGRVRSSGAEQNRLDAFHSLSSNLDNLLADDDAGIAPALQDLYAAFEDVSNDPSSIPVRQSLLSRGNAVATRFRNLDQQLDALSGQVNGQIHATVKDINTIADSIAQLNGRIATAKAAAGGQPPNDLLDKRDHLVDQLSDKVAVKTVAQDDGEYNVFIGNGEALVVGNRANKLDTRADKYDPSRLEVTLGSGAGSAVVTSQINGGTLGGALDARREVLDPARGALGRAAIGLASSVNEQHHLGMDLNGKLGGDFFSVGGPQVLPNSGNGGNAHVTATIADAKDLTGDNYRLQYDGTNWSLTRADTGEAVPMSGSGTSADPFVAKGLSVVVGSGAAAGDSYELRPTAAAAGSLKVAVDDPAGVAAASPIRTGAADGNSGAAKIDGVRVTDPADPGLLDAATIEFTSPTTYTINGGATHTYASGDAIAANGWELQISGTPEAGDTFTVESNSGGAGDNRNALALGALQTQGVLDDGNTSVSDAYSQLVAKVGTQTHQAKSNLDAQKTLHKQAQQAEQSVSGVNLDEEAANLVRYQQAYQAAARVITVSNTVFQSLIHALNG